MNYPGSSTNVYQNWYDPSSSPMQFQKQNANASPSVPPVSNVAAPLITDQMASAYSQAGYGAYPGGYPGSPSYPPDRAYNAVLANFDEARRNEQHEAVDALQNPAMKLSYAYANDLLKQQQQGPSQTHPAPIYPASSPSDQYATLMNETMAEAAQKLVNQQHTGVPSGIPGTTLEPEEKHIPFSHDDPAWSVAVMVGMKTAFTDREKYYGAWNKQDKNDAVYPLPQKCKIAVIGDMGTGTAQNRAVLESAKKEKADLVLSLGDIYYCGRVAECELFWAVYCTVFPDQETRPPLWAVPGNHEYICGGEGFRKVLLGHSLLGNGKQDYSFFCLENEWLRLVAMDTGRHSNVFLDFMDKDRGRSAKLDPTEAEWVKERCGTNAPKKRTLFFSHHPYYSTFWHLPEPNLNFVDQLGAETLKDVYCWYWGHEHRCLVYDTELHGLRKGRCVGHAAMPEIMENVYDTTDPKRPFDRALIPSLSSTMGKKVFNIGYVMLNIDKQNISEEFIELAWNDGKEVKHSQPKPL